MLENHERKWGKKLNLGADIPISHVNPFSKKPVDDVPGDYSPKQKTKKKSKKSYYKERSKDTSQSFNCPCRTWNKRSCSKKYYYK